MIKKILEIVNKFSSAIGYTSNTPKSFISHILMIIRKRNYENDIIYNCIKKNKMLKNKFNQGGERPIYKKLKHINEQNWTHE